MKAKQFTVVVIVGLIGGLIGGILSSQTFTGNGAFAKDEKPLKEVRAEKFELVGITGKVRASLSTDPSGVATIFSIGQSEKHRFYIVAKPNGIVLSLRTSDHNSVNIVSADDETRLSFNSDRSTMEALRMSLRLDVDGKPSIKLYDSNYKTRLTLGSAELTTLETGSKEIRSEGSIVIFDKDGKVTHQLP